MHNDIPTVLEGIVNTRRTHLPQIRQRIAHVDPAALPRSQRSLFEALGSRGEQHFIMECKSSSPSLGLIREHYQPGNIARIYSRYASGISVLCEPDHFGGDYDHLAAVAASTHVPVLCKDFIIDPVQIHAARYFGADAILLMLSVLTDEEYTELSQEAHRLGLDVLTEVIDEEEVRRAISLGARIFGVNHRNLHDLSIDISRTEQLGALIPENAVLVAESGIRDHATVDKLAPFANGFLVGSQLTSQPDIDLAARALVYGENKVCGLTQGREAQVARAAGAIFGGLVFEEASPRNVSRETAKKIIRDEPGLRYVGVSRSTDPDFWASLPDELHAVQIHAPYQGEREQELIESVRAAVNCEVWRAVSMTNAGPKAAIHVNQLADRVILDSGEGGSGSTFDWSVIPAELKQHALLAGGIGPQQVPDALAVGCLGLDLNSGVEYPQGGKDAHTVIEAFLAIKNSRVKE